MCSAIHSAKPLSVRDLTHHLGKALFAPNVRSTRSGGLMRFAPILCTLLALPVSAASANPASAFADNCFSPFMTAARAAETLVAPGVRVDFYDLNPFSSADPSPVTGRAATPGTDRRCEVAFDGDHGTLAAQAAVTGLTTEGIETDAPLPTTHSNAGVPGTTLLAARFLNPKRIAVVHTGTRPGPNGVETFLLVERLTPEASTQQN
jgi:hypothetical protein